MFIGASKVIVGLVVKREARSEGTCFGNPIEKRQKKLKADSLSEQEAGWKGGGWAEKWYRSEALRKR